MDEHVVGKHCTVVETAVSCKRTQPVDDFAEEQVLDEAFRVLVLGLQAVPDHRVQADGFHLVIVISCSIFFSK